MKQQVVRIGPHQAGKVLGIMYLLMGVLVAGFMLLSAVFTSGDKTGMVIFAVAAPLGYGVIGYLFTVIAAALYNAIAAFVGGLEITVTVEESPKLS
jgi:hypothetical protein